MKPQSLLALLLVSGLAGCNHKTEPEPILIGHVAPLSGADKARGESARQGIALAIEEAGPVLDRRLIAHHADTRSDAAQVRPVLSRLLTVNRVVGVLGGPDVAAVDNVGSVAQSASVPFLLSTAPRPQPALDFVFFTGLTPAAQGRALGRFAGEEFKDGAVAVVSDGKHDALLQAFTQEISKEKLAGTWTYASADKLAGLAKEAAAKKPAAVLFAGGATELQSWLRAEPAARTPILFAGSEATMAEVGGMAIYLVTAFAADDPLVKEFAAKYQQRFNSPPDAAAALAYDDARMLFEAMRRAKSLDGAKIRKELAELHFDGLTGPIAFEAQHGVTRTAYIMKVSNGQAQQQKRYPPEEKQARLVGPETAR